MEKKHLINLFWLFIMFAILNGIYWLCAGHTVGMSTSTGESILAFILIVLVGIVIDFKLKEYTGQKYWTMKDIINKLKQH